MIGGARRGSSAELLALDDANVFQRLLGLLQVDHAGGDQADLVGCVEPVLPGGLRELAGAFRWLGTVLGSVVEQ